MSIKDVRSVARPNIAVFGHLVPDEIRTQASDLGYSIDGQTAPHVALAPDQLTALAAAAFFIDPTKPGPLVEAIGRHVGTLLDHGCPVLVFIGDQTRPTAHLDMVVNTLKPLHVLAVIPWVREGIAPHPSDPSIEGVCGEGPPIDFSRGYKLYSPYVQVYSYPHVWRHLIERAIRYGEARELPVDHPKVFNVIGEVSNRYPNEDRPLLRRGFSDCSEIHLRRLLGGRSASIDVYIANATLKNQVVGTSTSATSKRARPFFVKIGDRAKIITEWENYETRVRPFIPFHLAPRLNRLRCSLGGRRGALIGDFVEDSETLIECARSGRASTPIGTLFDRTLCGWHSQASNQTATLAGGIEWMLHKSIPSSRHRLARRAGASRSVPALKQTLLSASRTTAEFSFGPIHGDLHAGNVCVRGSDSILIDFFRSQDGPLLIDPAALEVSLLVHAPSNYKFRRRDWLEQVESFYISGPLTSGLVGADPSNRYAWLAACIRQIRLHASQMERAKNQYLTTVAHMLFFAAAMDADPAWPIPPEEEYRRAMAFYFADRIADIIH